MVAGLRYGRGMSNPYPEGHRYSEPQDPFATNPAGLPAVPQSPAPYDPDPPSYEPDPYPYGLQPQSPAPAHHTPQQPLPPQPPRPPAGWTGVDPITGAALSPKSKIIAGLLQLLPGLLLSLGGLGRLYAGHTKVGIIQLTASLLGWASLACGFALMVPWIVTLAVWLWFIVDGIVLLAGSPVDGKGRLMRS
jgi:TM2 domain-containing membrane protein YozV